MSALLIFGLWVLLLTGFALFALQAARHHVDKMHKEDHDFKKDPP